MARNLLVDALSSSASKGEAMTLDDVLLTARLVVDGRVHCVSDEAVKAMAQALLDAHWKPVAHADSPTLRDEAPRLKWKSVSHQLFLGDVMVGGVWSEGCEWLWRTQGHGPKGFMVSNGFSVTLAEAKAAAEASLAQSHTTERD